MKSPMSKAHLSARQHPTHPARIADQFGRAAAIYQAQATLQRHSAHHLLNLISAYQPCVPSGKLVEIGCGTGFITQGLIPVFPHHILEITDLSTGMLDFCRADVSIPDKQQHLISFQIRDGEKVQSGSQPYAAIVSGFVIQWFKNPADVLQNWFAQLKPGGFLFLSFPTCHSFPEWRQICAHNQLPFTANPLPDPTLLLQSFTDTQIRHQEIVQTVDTYPSAAIFFRGLKAIGAGFNQTAQRLTLQQMKHLIQDWDQRTSNHVKVSYQTMFLVIQK